MRPHEALNRHTEHEIHLVHVPTTAFSRRNVPLITPMCFELTFWCAMHVVSKTCSHRREVGMQTPYAKPWTRWNVSKTCAPEPLLNSDRCVFNEYSILELDSALHVSRNLSMFDAHRWEYSPIPFSASNFYNVRPIATLLLNVESTRPKDSIDTLLVYIGWWLWVW